MNSLPAANHFAVNVNVQRGEFQLRAQLTVAAGERIAVMGPSGAGKSTLLKAIAGQLPTSAPTLLVADASPSPGTPAQPGTLKPGTVQPGTVQLLEQNPLLFPHLSAAGNIEFALKARGVKRATARDQAQDWLDRVGLADLGSRLPQQLSGGQQQRVALARALCGSPSLLLLDEPLTALDPVTAAEIRDLITELLAAQEVAAVIVTHHVSDATALASRLILVENGLLTHDGTPAQVLAKPGTEFAAALSRSVAGPGTAENL